MNTIHIASGYSAFGCVNKALKESNNKELINIQEYFTIGPLFNIEEKNGIEKRVLYFKELFKSIYAEDMSEDLEHNISTTVLKQVATSFEPIVFWYSTDTHEQILLRALCKHISYERISLVNVSDVVIDTHKIIAVAQCSPEQLLQASSDSINITQKEHEGYAKEWDELMKSTALLHVYDGNNILGKSEDYYDAYILKECSSKFTTALKIIGSTMGKIEENIGDSFLDMRLRELIKQGKVIREGKDAPLCKMRVKIK